MFPLRKIVIEQIIIQKKQAIELLENETNLNISYENISPSILHAFEIRGLKISSHDNPEVSIFEIERVRLRFNIFKFSLSNPLNAFIGLTIVNSDFIYDMNKSDSINRILTSIVDGSRKQTSTGYRLPDNFTIKGKNLSLKLITGKLDIILSSLFFTIGSSQGGDLTVTAKTETALNLYGLSAPLPVAELNINTRMTFTGRLSPDLEWADIDINSKNFRSNIFSIDRIKWNLKYNSPGHLSLTKTGDNIPVDLALTTDVYDNSLKIEIHAQNFIFTEYFEEAEALVGYHLVLGSVVSGNSSAEFRFNSGDFIYSGDLLVENIQGITDFPLNIAADFNGENRNIIIADSLLTSRLGTLGYEGTIKLTDNLPLLNGMLRISNFTFKDYTIGSLFSIKTDKGGNYHVEAESAEINNLILRQISADVLPYGDSLDFRLTTGILDSDGRINFINSEGNIQIGDDYFIQAAINTDNLPVEPILELLPGDLSLPGAIRDLRLTTSIFLSGTLEELAFASPLISLKDTGSQEKSLSFALSGNNSGFRINSIKLNWLGNSLTGKISTDLTENNDLILRSQFLYNNISFESSGVFDNEGNLSLIGDYGLKFNLIKNFGKGYNISLKIDRFPFLIIPEKPSYASVNAMGLYNSREEWNLLVNDISIEQLPVPSGEGRIGASLLLSRDGGSLYHLSYSDSFSKLNGQGSLLFDSFGRSPAGRLQLSAYNQDLNENYDVKLILKNDILDGGLRFNNLPVSRLSDSLPFDGFINGQLSVKGTVEDPELALSLNTARLKFNNESVELKAELNYSDLSIAIEEISGSSGDLVFDNITGQIDLKSGSHLISGSLNLDSRFFNLASEYSIKAETIAISSFRDISSIMSRDFSARLDITKLLVNQENKDLWSIRLINEDEVLSLSGGPDYSINGSMYADGFFILNASAPFPLTFAASGTLESGIINANITDINYIFDNLEIPYFYIYEGSITGGVRVRGGVNDPDLFGQINLNNMVFKPPVVEDITEKFSTSIFFREKALTMPATRVPTNNGLVFITMNAVIQKWLPYTYDLNLKIPENKSISAKYYYSPFYVFGFAEGGLRIFGDLTTMRIDGDLKIINGIMILNNNLDAKKLESATEYVAADLRLTTGENNQLYWPSREIPIVNGFLSADNKITMHYNNSLSEFWLEGDLNLKGGEIFYFERNFYVKEGHLKFSNTSLVSIDPLLSTKAEIRDINSQGELTRIYLIVDESPLSNFAPRFESDPSLSTVEIISLLGGNFMDSISSSGSFDIGDALLTSVDLFTQFAIFQGVENTLKSTLGLDLLSIRSSFLANIVEDKFISLSGNSSVTNFAKYLDNTTLFLGKYFTDDIFIQGLFQFDLYNNTGYSEGLNIDSEVKLEWEGPVTNIELSFFPDFYDPVGSLNRTSVGISWRFSY